MKLLNRNQPYCQMAGNVKISDYVIIEDVLIGYHGNPIACTESPVELRMNSN